MGIILSIASSHIFQMLLFPACILACTEFIPRIYVWGWLTHGSTSFVIFTVKQAKLCEVLNSYKQTEGFNRQTWLPSQGHRKASKKSSGHCFLLHGHPLSEPPFLLSLALTVSSCFCCWQFNFLWFHVLVSQRLVIQLLTQAHCLDIF